MTYWNSVGTAATAAAASVEPSRLSRARALPTDARLAISAIVLGQVPGSASAASNRATARLEDLRAVVCGSPNTTSSPSSRLNGTPEQKLSPK